MFDPSLVVQSAVSSFNNIALRGPDFFWSALLCLPIFAIFWIFAPEISKRFLPGDFKAKRQTLAGWSVLFIAVWLLTHQNFDALRDGVSMGLLTVTAACIFVISLFAGWRVESVGSLIKTKENPPSPRLRWTRWKKRTDVAAPFVVAVVVGLCAFGNWHAALVQFAAVLFGFGAGRWMIRNNRAEFDLDFIVIALTAALTFGLIMQPEFFRFGQLGHLTVIHILFLMAAALAIIGSIMTRVVRPSGWLKESWYKKLMWLARAIAVMVFVLFILTESALAFLCLGLVFAATSFLAVRHHAAKDAPMLKSASEDLWVLSLCLFGILTAMPVLVCAAIILMREKPKFDAAGAIRSLI
ncbi:MAG: hypothetical protein FWF97_02555 [Alphaproteobacteria bacterium]|nr:hypothetical protein [Alphaproteobacteria bacterium]